MIVKEEVIPLLLRACPSFKPVLDKWINDEDYTPSVYLDLGEFARHIVHLYQNSKTDEFLPVFNVIEGLHTEGDHYVKEAATIGLLETLQNNALSEKVDLNVFLAYLGPVSREYWDKVIKSWETGEIIK